MSRAWYDFAFRPGYPKQLKQLILSSKNFNSLKKKQLCVVDFCCGTGQAAHLFSDQEYSLYLVDRSQSMISYAQKRLQNLPTSNFFRANAENFIPPNGLIDIALFGRSFHLTNRSLMLGALSNQMSSEGRLFIFGDGPLGKSPLSHTKGQSIKQLLRHWLVEQGILKRTPSNKTPPPATHEDFIEHSQFTIHNSHALSFTRRWSKEEVVGHLLSTCIVPESYLQQHYNHILEFLSHEVAQYMDEDGVINEKAELQILECGIV